MTSVYIIGVRGIPNRYGGFERLIEVLAPHLVSKGYDVTVFCNHDPIVNVNGLSEDVWMGVRRRFVDVHISGPLGTIEYDWRSFNEVPEGAIALIFGYGTGLFQCYLKRRGIPHAVNMDGIEWRREKWGRVARAWLRFNERAAARQANILIADHPEIKRYLRDELRANSTMIAYGVDEDALHRIGPDFLLEHPLLAQYAEQDFSLVVARPEPENQIHVTLEAFERSKKRKPMLVLGNFDINEYGRRLRKKHSDVHFAGGVYDAQVLNELRRRSELYIHGHSVGGTNPSLIEAMAAGALIVAHDNPFNRWVMGEQSGLFFSCVEDLVSHMDNPPEPTKRYSMTAASQRRCVDQFLWSRVLSEYDEVVARLSSAL